MNRDQCFRTQVFKIAATYVGTVVGAGFASGQETLRFFGSYGRFGLAGIAVSTLLFCGYGILVMDLGRRMKAHSHREILRHVCGTHIGQVMDMAVTLFLGVTLTVMLAGGGAIFAEQLGLPHSAGTLFTAFLSGITILAGMRGIMTANSIVVPLLTLAVLGLSSASIHFHGLQPILAKVVPWPALAPVKSWFLAAWLYVGYNLVLSISVLGPLGAAVQDRRALIAGGLTGGLTLGLLAAGIKLAVDIHMPDIGRFEVPMLFLARLHSRPIQWFYTLVLWAEIYTTAISCAYGFAARVSEMVRGQYQSVVLITTIVAVFGSRFGFSTLMSLLYPLFGFATLIVLFCLGIMLLRQKSA